MKTSIKSKILGMFMILTMVMTLMPSIGFAATYGDIEVSIPSGENLVLTHTSTSSNTYYYDVDSTLSGYYPSVFSLQIAPDAGASITEISTNNNSEVTNSSGTYYLTTLEEGTTTTITIKSATSTYILNCDAPDGGSTGSLSGIYAFLPAPGQFANEYMTSGGWGSIYTSGQTAVKDMTDAKASTGVSLGFFGGYVVLDYGTPSKDASGHVTSGIYNDPSNEYGVDFILYGNAFNGNSEPGCVQVSKNGTDWYDIAGSLYYKDATVSGYSLTYTNPTPSDDANTTYGFAGTTYTNGVSYTGDSSGTIDYNPWHAHGWFPLHCNYFTSQIQSLGALDKTSVLPFASYNLDTTNGSTLTMEGVMLGTVQNTSTGDQVFGYCDVHPNGSATSTAYNPYAVTASTTGGDPIDISWAVDSNGEPKDLDSIRFIRVYTGAKKMNGMFGEISTEVCGSYRATSTGSGAPTTDLNIKNGRSTVTHSNMGTTTVSTTKDSITLKIKSDEAYVYVNGDLVDCTSSASYNHVVNINPGETKYVQVMTQNGTEEGYITLIKVTR